MTEEQKIERMGVKVQASVKSNPDQILNDGWKTVQNRKATNVFGDNARPQANGVAEYSSTHV